MSVLNPAQTSAPRLVLDRSDAQNPLLDGAWWPRSTDPETELPALVLAFDEQDEAVEPVTRLTLNAVDWPEHLIKVTVGERVVRAGYFAGQPANLITVICGRDKTRFDLLVVPPDTEPDVADAAMKVSVAEGNQVQAQDIVRSVLAETQLRR